MPKKSRFDPTNLKSRLKSLPKPLSSSEQLHNKMVSLAHQKLDGLNWRLGTNFSSEYASYVELEPMYPETFPSSEFQARIKDFDVRSYYFEPDNPPNIVEVPLEFLARVPQAGTLFQNGFPFCHLVTPMLAAAHLPNPGSQQHQYLQKRFIRIREPSERGPTLPSSRWIGHFNPPLDRSFPSDEVLERVDTLKSVFGQGDAQLLVSFIGLDDSRPNSDSTIVRDCVFIVNLTVLPISRASIEESDTEDNLSGEESSVKIEPPKPVSRGFGEAVQVSLTDLKIVKNFPKFLENKTFKYWHRTDRTSMGFLILDLNEALNSGVFGDALVDTDFLFVKTYDEDLPIGLVNHKFRALNGLDSKGSQNSGVFTVRLNVARRAYSSGAPNHQQIVNSARQAGKSAFQAVWAVNPQASYSTAAFLSGHNIWSFVISDPYFRHSNPPSDHSVKRDPVYCTDNSHTNLGSIKKTVPIGQAVVYSAAGVPLRRDSKQYQPSLTGSFK